MRDRNAPSGRLRRERRARYPDEPWRWREDWEQGMIRASREGGPVVVWLQVFAVLAFGGVLAALVWDFGRNGLGNDDPVFWVLALLFASIGLFAVWWAGVATARRLRFGRPVLRLDETPCVLGGQLRGTIDFGGRQLPTVEQATVELRERCWLPGAGVRSQTGSRVLWSLRVPVAWRPHDSVVPIQLPIPSDGRAPDGSNLAKLGWRLRLCASMPGPDLDVQFDLPVFAGEGGDTAQTKEVLDATVGGCSPAEREDVLIENLRREGIRLERCPAGLGLRVCPIGLRHWGPAGLALAIMAVPAGFWFTALRAHPTPAFWVTFALLAGLGAVVGSLTLGKSVRIRAGSKGLRIVRRILGVPTVWQVPYESIESIRTNSRYGGYLPGEENYYDLDIKWQVGGKDRGVRVALGIPDIGTASALAQALLSAREPAAPREEPVSGRTKIPSGRVLTARQERFPEEPWRWREDWEQGTVLASTDPEDGSLAAWVAAVLVPISLGAAWRSGNGQWLWKGGPAPWLPVAILAMVAVGLVVRAIVATRRLTRYGRTFLKLATNPCAQGGEVRGMIEFAAGRRPAFRKAELELQERDTRRWEEYPPIVVWRLTVFVPLSGTERSIPFCLPIPSDGEQTSLGEVDWRIRLHASTVLDVAFEIPVFATGGGNPAQTKAAIEKAVLNAVNAGGKDVSIALAEVLQDGTSPKL